MNTHDIELPPLPKFDRLSSMHADDVARLLSSYGRKCASAAIEAALQSQDREGIIKAARAAMNESFEVGDEYGSIGIPSDRAAYLSLLLDEYDHARRAEGDGE